MGGRLRRRWAVPPGWKAARNRRVLSRGPDARNASAAKFALSSRGASPRVCVTGFLGRAHIPLCPRFYNV